jgi:hypothetical protein
LAIRIHCTRHHKVVNASHTPTVLWLINHSKKSKTPLMILAFTKKKTNMKRWNCTWTLSLFFPWCMGRKVLS